MPKNGKIKKSLFVISREIMVLGCLKVLGKGLNVIREMSYWRAQAVNISLSVT